MYRESKQVLYEGLSEQPWPGWQEFTDLQSQIPSRHCRPKISHEDLWHGTVLHLPTPTFYSATGGGLPVLPPGGDGTGHLTSFFSWSPTCQPCKQLARQVLCRGYCSVRSITSQSRRTCQSSWKVTAGSRRISHDRPTYFFFAKRRLQAKCISGCHSQSMIKSAAISLRSTAYIHASLERTEMMLRRACFSI